MNRWNKTREKLETPCGHQLLLYHKSLCNGFDGKHEASLSGLEKSPINLNIQVVFQLFFLLFNVSKFYVNLDKSNIFSFVVKVLSIYLAFLSRRETFTGSKVRHIVETWDENETPRPLFINYRSARNSLSAAREKFNLNYNSLSNRSLRDSLELNINFFLFNCIIKLWIYHDTQMLSKKFVNGLQVRGLWD